MKIILCILLMIAATAIIFFGYWLQNQSKKKETEFEFIPNDDFEDESFLFM